MNLREDRLLVIEKRLAEQGRVVSTELAEMLDVPVDMIRRDLRDLAARGACRRVYGGAVKAPVASRLCRREPVTVLMIRKCSCRTRSGRLALASATAAPLISAAVVSRVIAATSVLRMPIPPR